MVLITACIFFFKDELVCKDDETYAGDFGEKCKDWDTKNCLSDAWQVDLLERRELVERCPKSCRQCGKDREIWKPVIFFHIQ